MYPRCSGYPIILIHHHEHRKTVLSGPRRERYSVNMRWFMNTERRTRRPRLTKVKSKDALRCLVDRRGVYFRVSRLDETVTLRYLS